MGKKRLMIPRGFLLLYLRCVPPSPKWFRLFKIRIAFESVSNNFVNSKNYSTIINQLPKANSLFNGRAVVRRYCSECVRVATPQWGVSDPATPWSQQVRLCDCFFSHSPIPGTGHFLFGICSVRLGGRVLPDPKSDYGSILKYFRGRPLRNDIRKYRILSTQACSNCW